VPLEQMKEDYLSWRIRFIQQRIEYQDGETKDRDESASVCFIPTPRSAFSREVAGFAGACWSDARGCHPERGEGSHKNQL